LLAGSHVVPTSYSESDSRLTGARLAVGRILGMQIGVGAAVALISLALKGQPALISALVGAATGVMANAYMMFKALRPARSARGALGQLLMGQLVKIALTIAAFLWAARIPHVSWLALMCAYAGTLVVVWWMPMTAPRTKNGSEGVSL
jgi:F0F1-type ATP synthase assembly protein I